MTSEQYAAMLRELYINSEIKMRSEGEAVFNDVCSTHIGPSCHLGLKQTSILTYRILNGSERDFPRLKIQISIY